jgi:hypothetical protein
MRLVGVARSLPAVLEIAYHSLAADDPAVGPVITNSIIATTRAISPDVAPASRSTSPEQSILSQGGT